MVLSARFGNIRLDPSPPMSPNSERDSPCLLPEPVITKARGSAATEGGTAGSGGNAGGQSRSGGGGGLSSSLSKFGTIQLASDLFSENGENGGGRSE